MTLIPAWQTDTDPLYGPSSRRLFRVLVLIAIGGGLGIFWRELFEALVYAASRISSLG